MRFPFVVARELDARQRERFHRHIDSDASGWHRRFTESIWRRHQHPSNARLSGWTNEQDRKRRIVHFYDEYAICGGAFVLKNAYLFLSVTLPEDDIAAYRAALADGLYRGAWTPVARASAGVQVHRRGDLHARVALHRVHPEDARRG
jgi:hypothetical protein